MIVLAGGAASLVVAASGGVERAQAAAPTPVTVAVLRDAPPFSYQTEDGIWHGLAVELWNLVAADLQLETRYVGMNRAELITAVGSGGARFGVGALAITAERLARVDFSAPFAVTGVAIAVAHGERTLGRVLWDIVCSRTFLRLAGALVGLLLVMGTILAVIERRSNPDFGGRRIHGLGSGIWLAIVTMTTVGYGDKLPRTFGGRAIASLWMLASVVLISIFTGTIATLLTLERIGPRVRGFEDLAGARIVCVRDSAGAQLLAERHLRARQVSGPEEAMSVLLAGEADALVHDRALLAWTVNEHPDLPIGILPGSLHQEFYAVAMTPDEPLRRTIDAVIARTTESPMWSSLRFDYLGRGHEQAALSIGPGPGN